MFLTLLNQAFEVTGFCHRFNQSSAAFSGNGGKWPRQTPPLMHIALARPLLPPHQVMHCPSADFGDRRIYGSCVR
jgi:hypothetical protein